MGKTCNDPYRKTYTLVTVVKVVLLSLILNITITFPTNAETPVFNLTDYLGRSWSNESVEYTLDQAHYREITGKKLVDASGKETLFQVDEQLGLIRFLADLQSFSTNSYSFVNTPPSLPTDLAIRQTAEYVEISNSRAGIRIARNLTGRNTPLLAWKLASGSWVGKTEFLGEQSIVNYELTITEQGPVIVQISCAIQFSNNDTWNISFSLQAFDPAIKVHETFSCNKKREFRFIFNDNFPAAYVLSRSSSRQPLNKVKYEYGTYIRQVLKDKQSDLLLFEPWLHWGGKPTRTTSFSLVDADWNDTFFLASSSPEKWVNPEIADYKRARVFASLGKRDNGDVALAFDLKHGEREYLIGSVAGAVDLKNYKEKNRISTLAQVSQMKHSDFPLNRIKDYTLSWDNKKLLGKGYLPNKQLNQLKSQFTVDHQELQRLRKNPFSLSRLEKYVPYVLVTRDPELEKKLIKASIDEVKKTFDMLSRLESGTITVGIAPHHYRIFITVCNMLGLVYDSPLWEDRDKKRLNAQLAFLGYVFNSQAFSSPARGYAGFPNMTACVYGVRAAIASVLPGHPKKRVWMQKSINDFKSTFVDKWTDKNGEWTGINTESFHYTMVTLDMILGAFYRSYMEGVDTEAVYNPVFKEMGRWLAEVSTPRDSRILDWRHFPPVGHVPKFEVVPGFFAIMAAMWQERDPVFASEMKWMQLEHGDRQVQAVGDFSPSFAGYRELFMRNGIQPITPDYKSKLYKESGVILRNHYNQKYENMLYMVAGKGHTHYDQDSGSITIWGKGEIIADDFGYGGHAPGEDHNMIESIAAPAGKLMDVTSFEPGPYLDYVSGKKEAWERRILFVKNDQPEAPQYFVINDALPVKIPAHWRLWLTADDVKLDGLEATVTGLNMVDTDIVFANLPTNTVLTTENKTRQPFGLNSQGDYPGVNPSSQTGIIINSPDFKQLLALVYPRLKSDPKAEVTSIADGGGFKVSTLFGTDYIFLSKKKIIYTEGPLYFKGTVGLARISGDDVTLELKETGVLIFGDNKVFKGNPGKDTKDDNLIPNGGLVEKKYSIFPEQQEGAIFTVDLADKSPESGSQGTTGGYYQKITWNGKGDNKWRSFLPLTTNRIFINPEYTYKIRASVYLPEANKITISSYGLDKDGYQITRENGITWGWSLTMQGPTDGFKEFETTIGPAGGDAEAAFIPGVIALQSLGARIYGKGDSFWIKELDVQRVH